MAAIDSEMLEFFDRRFASIETQLRDIHREMREDRDRNSERFRSIEQRFDALESKVQHVDDKLTTHIEVGHNGNGGPARKIALGTGAAAGGGGIAYTVWDAITRHFG